MSTKCASLLKEEVMPFEVEKAAHWGQLIGIVLALGALIATGFQIRQTREANITYQGTALCEAYREQVIDLHHLGYDAGEIRSTFLGEHDDVTKAASESNNVYIGFYRDECGSIEGITGSLSAPPPLQESKQR
jgi:hypothetical protein